MFTILLLVNAFSYLFMFHVEHKKRKIISNFSFLFFYFSLILTYNFLPLNNK